ncbi:hypothetical protein FA13DRAFT_1627875 [Coprinellus micaceus]|uniref:F-box domain-containing protein n=1 Tax=Coprinellus micaceus TaxID=71717 RepID=A0A4Y7TGE3_COPMI|nr:hypothetical protein FA13DRAFT_1627875 [Coprinellus micaceus]
MVSAENLNLDVLELIFAHLSGHDLTSVSLVSRTFFAGAIPTLYRNITYRLKEAKAHDTVMSPFAVLLQHKSLANHVRTIDLQAVPKTNNLKIRIQPHSTFMRDCRKAIELCTSLHTFRCTEPNVVPAFLMSLQNKPNLQSVRVNSNFTAEQAKLLTNLGNLNDVFLELASWNMVDALPRWTMGLQKALTSLVLYRTEELNETALELTLKELPELKGLHIVQCTRMDHVTILNLLAHTPNLEALSMTTFEKSRPIPTPLPPLPSLQHLAIDARYHMSPSPTPAILASLLEQLKLSAPTLSSFSIKLPERKITVQHGFIEKLVDAYGYYLRKLAFLDCVLELKSIEKIAQDCEDLERLDVSIPIRESYAFATAISAAQNLTTLVDIESHAQHGINPSLNLEQVEYFIETVPSLRKVVSGRRIWIPGNVDDGDYSVKLDRRLPYRSRPSWFLPSSKYPSPVPRAESPRTRTKEGDIGSMPQKSRTQKSKTYVRR